MDDPEELAVLLVQQWLKDKGWTDALAKTEAHTKLTFVESKLPRGSMLMEMLYTEMERRYEDDDEARIVARAAAEVDLLLNQTPDVQELPTVLEADLDASFDAGVLSVQCCPGETAVISGLGNSVVQRVDFEGNIVWRTSLGGGGTVSLALQPASGDGSDRMVAAGSMDGSVSLLSAVSGELLCGRRVHRKYVVSLAWAADARTFVSASWDASFAVHRLQLSSDAVAEVAFETLATVQFASLVTSVTVLRDGDTCVAGIRGSNYLRLYSLSQLKETKRVNMNAQDWDDHVSFSATHLAESPNGKMLAVSTDGPRIVIYRIESWTQVSNIYGLPTAEFQVPCAVWLGAGACIAAAAAHGGIYFFHTGTAKALHHIVPHPGNNVRSLDYDPDTDRLATCSFDKTVKIFRPEVTGRQCDAITQGQLMTVPAV